MNVRRAFRNTIKICAVVAACGCALAAVGGLWYLFEFYPRTADAFEVNSPDLPNRILVATQGSDFKNGLVAAVCNRLRTQPVYIKGVDLGELDDVDISEWNKVLVINTAMMNIMSGPARRLVAQGEGLDNVLLFITSGGADFYSADLAVDALSGASRKVDTDRLAGLISDWAAGNSEGDWIPGDHVLALEYFLQVDVKAACAAIASDRARYQRLYPGLERRLNRAGYALRGRGLLRDALQAFRLNRDLFPESWNVYDSYAEALQAGGRREEAITNYRKSLALNPNREAGQKKLAELENRT